MTLFCLPTSSPFYNTQWPHLQSYVEWCPIPETPLLLPYNIIITQIYGI
jgi:hypothetical protein